MGAVPRKLCLRAYDDWTFSLDVECETQSRSLFTPCQSLFQNTRNWHLSSSLRSRLQTAECCNLLARFGTTNTKPVAIGTVQTPYRNAGFLTPSDTSSGHSQNYWLADRNTMDTGTVCINGSSQILKDSNFPTELTPIRNTNFMRFDKNVSKFLSVFAKLQKATISCVMSVRPFETTLIHQTYVFS